LFLISRAASGTIRYWETVNAFSTAFTRGLPHGVIAAVHLPETTDDIPNAILHRLHADEREFAAGLDGHRLVQWVGGRLASRLAVRALGEELGPLLNDERGAPRGPKGLSISIAHKKTLAIAIASRRRHGQVGIDFEVIGRDRQHIAEKILVPAEMADVAELSDERQWIATLIRFALKEAIYKALAPRLQRYIAFDEAQITRVKDGSADVQLMLASTDGPSSIDARYEWVTEGLITTVRARWDGSQSPTKL
jgi:holo-[acyl-carrier-protein] synthase